MTTFYKNHNVWYITTSYENQRLTRSLKKKDKQIAKKLKPIIKLELLEELTGAKPRNRNLQITSKKDISEIFDRNAWILAWIFNS